RKNNKRQRRISKKLNLVVVVTFLSVDLERLVVWELLRTVVLP
ncbi:hypothetical protein CP8484711_0035B, partial [Chlamydia psittaci 84-8471/1]